MPSFGGALVEVLRAHGTHEIFGIPGDSVLPFLKAIEESGTLPFSTFDTAGEVARPVRTRVGMLGTAVLNADEAGSTEPVTP